MSSCPKEQSSKTESPVGGAHRPSAPSLEPSERRVRTCPPPSCSLRAVAVRWREASAIPLIVARVAHSAPANINPIASLVEEVHRFHPDRDRQWVAWRDLWV